MIVFRMEYSNKGSLNLLLIDLGKENYSDTNAMKNII